jgi:hypothetical protein
LVMVEPPGKFWRVGIFEIYDRVLVAVKKSCFPRLRSAMRHAAECKFRSSIKTLAIKTIEKRGGGSAIETSIVKTQPYFSHRERSDLILPTVLV